MSCLLTFTPISRIKTHLQTTPWCGLFLPAKAKMNTITYILGKDNLILSWAVSAKTGADTNVHHLQAHVSCLLSHIFQHVLTQFGLLGSRPYHMAFALGPLSKLKHHPKKTSNFKHERARSEIRCTQALLFRDITMYEKLLSDRFSTSRSTCTFIY